MKIIINREELILRLKEAGQSIIDNAESIVGDEKIPHNLRLTIETCDIYELPVITINKEIIPEGFINRLQKIK